MRCGPRSINFCPHGQFAMLPILPSAQESRSLYLSRDIQTLPICLDSRKCRHINISSRVHMIVKVETVDRDGDQRFGQACVAWIRRTRQVGASLSLGFTFHTSIIFERAQEPRTQTCRINIGASHLVRTRWLGATISDSGIVFTSLP